MATRPQKSQSLGNQLRDIYEQNQTRENQKHKEMTKKCEEPLVDWSKGIIATLPDELMKRATQGLHSIILDLHKEMEEEVQQIKHNPRSLIPTGQRIEILFEETFKNFEKTGGGKLFRNFCMKNDLLYDLPSCSSGVIRFVIRWNVDV